ncbi:MAG: superoxide dismutase family protein [Ruminococcus sp.]|nr:superoxide dismutase family protein [Ruminococcus sp.]
MRINNRILMGVPQAYAHIKGSEKYPTIKGVISFYAMGGGTVVVTEINGLPRDDSFFAMHIHNGSSCSGNSEDPFTNSGTHLDFTDDEHPFHTGDLPVILSNNGYSWSAVFTDRFRPCQVRGCVVIIHADADDYRTQPSGNSGKKIACGIIR